MSRLSWAASAIFFFTACAVPAPSDGAGGSAGSLSASSGSGLCPFPDGGFTCFPPPHPRCYFDADCDYSALDGGACVEGMCVPHPPGWCLGVSDCPAPPDLSCASAVCDPIARLCGIFNKPAGNPCGAAGHACDGNGNCAPKP